MFRIFLKREIRNQEKPNTQPSKRNERRDFPRFEIDHKQLNLLNEQDILTVSDISLKGIRCEISEKAFSRYRSGQSFEAKLKYGSEIFDLKLYIAWTSRVQGQFFLGLSFIKPGRKTIDFINRIVKPLEIGKSLTLIAPENTIEGEAKLWFTGDDAEFFLWQENDEILSWLLNAGRQSIMWEAHKGFSTGVVIKVGNLQVNNARSTNSDNRIPDKSVDRSRKQFAFDVLMALQHPLRDNILNTF